MKLRRSGQDFTLVQCTQCGLIALHPIPPPDALRDWYAPSYYGSNGQKFISFIQWLRLLSIKKKVRRIEKMIRQRSGTILDIGCADGTFLFNIKKRRWSTVGLELSNAWGNEDRKTDLNIVVGDIIEQHLPDQHFDVITLWHVFEHITEPKRYLSEIARILKPNGLLVITLPNIDSWQARLFRNTWFHLDVPRHIFQYSPKTISLLLEQFGLHVRTIEHFSLEYNPYGYIQSALNALLRDDNRTYELLKSHAFKCDTQALRFLASGLLIVILIIPSLIAAAVESLARRGGTVKLFAQRSNREP